MKELQVTWKGVTPLIMHSNKCVNPLHPLTLLMKEYTAKRKKTEDDYRIMSDIEWLQGLYFNEDINRKTKPLDKYLTDDMYIYMKPDNVEATIKNAAKKFKLGKDVEAFLSVTDSEVQFVTDEHRKIKDYWKDYRYRDVRPMKIGQSTVTRTRPRFDRWSIDFTLMFDDTKIDITSIITVIEYAGQYTGLCDSRPKYGKFVATIHEL